MSLCINPYCLQPDHPGNDGNRFCQSCGSDLVLQGRYRVMRLLSDKSGFGKVYDAYERSTPKILKVLKEVHNQHSKAIELFQQEAVVLSQLRHPGVPAIDPDGYFQFFPRHRSDPVHCLVMEKVDGPNLREWMKQQGNHPISQKQALNWLEQLAEILHLVHQKNYFHRDIKPENIMLRSSGQLVLVDFGAAREMTYTYLAQLGGSGSVTRISSAGYTPPEQEKGQAVPQSDFYALGCTFIYLLTGKQPTEEGIYDSLNNEFHWQGLAPQVSPEFAAFIDKLTAPKASDRPKDTQEILTTLAQLKQTLTHSSSNSAQPTGQPTPERTVLSASTVVQGNRPKRWLMAGVAAVAIGLSGYGAWAIYQTLQSPSGQTEAIDVIQTFKGHSGYVNDVLLSTDGETLISASADKTIKLWNLSTGQLIRTLTGHNGFVNVLAISPDGQTLVSGDADRTIIVWEVATGKPRYRLSGDASYINALAISPDGQQLASGGTDGAIRLWTLATGKQERILLGHTEAINALRFSPDGNYVVSGSADTSIRLWNADHGQLQRTINPDVGYVNAIAISPDGQTLYCAGTNSVIKRWDLVTSTVKGELVGHTGFINDLFISPDGKTLISSSADQTVKLWNLATKRDRYTLTGYGTHISYFAVDPSRHLLMTGSNSQTIQVWKLPADE